MIEVVVLPLGLQGNCVGHLVGCLVADTPQRRVRNQPLPARDMRTSSEIYNDEAEQSATMTRTHLDDDPVSVRRPRHGEVVTMLYERCFRPR